MSGPSPAPLSAWALGLTVAMALCCWALPTARRLYLPTATTPRVWQPAAPLPRVAPPQVEAGVAPHAARYPAARAHPAAAAYTVEPLRPPILVAGVAGAVAFAGALLLPLLPLARRSRPWAIAPLAGLPGVPYAGRTPSPPPRVAPLCGRRSAKIATTKNRSDLRKAKLYARFGKMIIMAVRAGGSVDEAANLQLREVLREARVSNVPNTNIERALKRGSEDSSADYRETIFEAYGKGGAGLMITVLSDNANRSSSDVKAAISKAGLTTASPGSVGFNFRRLGAIVCPNPVPEDVAVEAALEAEVDDVVVKEGEEEGEWLVVAEPKQLTALKEALESKGVQCEGTKLIHYPVTTVECSEEDREFNLLAIEKLEDLDDVDMVEHNMV